MDSDSEDEDWKERSDGFLRKLYAFHERNGTPIRRLPTLGGRELNLYHLYLKVRELNGAEEVTRNRQWGEVVRSFKLPRSVTSASYAIRQHYMKLLGKFEAYENDPNFANYFHSSTPPSSSHSPSPSPFPSSRATPPPSSTSATATGTHPLSHTLTASQHHSTPTSQSWVPHMSKSLSTVPTYQRPVVPSDGVIKSRGRECDKVIRSLVSGFPNEVDFALNVLTMMSFEKPESIPIIKVPYLLDVLLSHVAVFPEDDYGLETLFLECWSRASEMEFFEFWENTVPEWVYNVIFPQHPSHVESSLPGECTLAVYRVSQVTNILRNLSFETSHAQFLSQHEAMLRFLYLSCNCSAPTVCGLALDTLTNLAPFILLPIDGDSFSVVSLLFTSIHQWVLSSDKLAVLRGVEILGELTWCAHNEAIISGTPHEVYRRLFELLLLPDCFLLLTTLNTVYNLSLLGREIAAKLLAVDRAISILLSLLTLRVESFGDKALKQLKLIDTNPSASADKSDVSTSSKQVLASVKGGGGVQFRILSGGALVPMSLAGMAKQTGAGASLKASNSSPQTVNSAANKSPALKIGNVVIPTLNFGKKQHELGGTTLSPLLHSTLNSTNPVVKAVLSPSLGPLTLEQLQSLLVKSIPVVQQASVQKSVGSSSASTTTVQGTLVKPPNSTVSSTKLKQPVVNKLKVTNGQQPIATSAKTGTTATVHGGVTAEGFTASWLKTNFEESRGSYMTQMEVYSQYIKACSDAGQSKMLNLSDFTKSVKKEFPNSLSTRITFANQIVYMIAGLARKQVSSIASLKGDTISSPSLSNLVATSSKSRTPSPSLSLPSSNAISHTAPTATNSTAQPSHKSKEHSPSPSLPNDQIVANNRISPSPSIYSTASSHHIPAASSPLLKSQDRSSISPSPSLQNPLLLAAGKDRSSLSPSPSPSLQNPILSAATTRSSLSPTPSLSSMSNHVPPGASNRIAHLTKSRESSPSPLGSGISRSPTPSTIHTSQSILLKSTHSRDSISPTPPPPYRNLPTNALEERKRSVSPASSLQSSISNSDHPKSTVKSKPRDLDSSFAPFTAVGLSTLSSRSSSSIQSHASSISSLKSQQDSNDVSLPESKRIKLDGHDGVRNELLSRVSRTPSPQIFSKEKVNMNGQEYVRPASTIARTCGSFSTGLTSLTTSTVRHSAAAQSTGQTDLMTSNQSAFTPASLRGTTSTENTPPVRHTGLAGLTTSTRSAFTPASTCTTGNNSTLSNSASVLSNGTRIEAALDLTNDRGFTRSNEESIEVDDALELLTGPSCQWANCTRRCRSQYSLFSHLVYDHLPLLPSYPHQCLWQGCPSSSVRRMRPSLMTHLQTHHCYLEPKPAPLNVAKTLQQLRAMSPFQNEEESPLTKAVRLTAALVLRNLARISPEARMSLRCHESQLCQVALSDSEASTAAAQCLHFISTPPP